MKKTRFTETRIVSIIKQQEAGLPTADICREHGISQATFYNWKAKYGGMEVREVKRMKELEIENAKLKKMYAEISMENYALKDLIEKKL
jgi:putative transposase